MIYSKINDTVCCLPCLLFCKHSKKKLAKFPRFSKWHKVSDKLNSYVNNGTHSTAMTAASGFNERFEKPSSALTYGYDNQRTERVKHNYKILK